MTAALHGKSLCAAVMTVSFAFSLTVEQRLAYEQDGLVALPGAVTRSAASAMADQLWRAMEGQYGARRDKPATWTMHIPSGLKPDPADAFAAMASPTVVAVLDELLGANWIRPARWGMPLVTFPSPAIEWDVPAKQWHLDGPATPEAPAIARIFLLLAPVPPGSGGTLIAAGSHRLVRRLAAKAGRTLRSPEAKEQLAADYHWFTDLMSAKAAQNRIGRFMETGAVIDDVPTRVLEMTGEAGDVYFMHPNALHAPAPNASKQPRLMLTQWIEGKR